MSEARTPESHWFWDHFDWAAKEIKSFLGDDDLSVEGRTVADVGCGDGIMSLGVFDCCQPAGLVGFDIRLTDSDLLRRRAREEA